MRDYIRLNRDLIIGTMLSILGVWILLFLVWQGVAYAQVTIDEAIAAAEIDAAVRAATGDELPGWAVAVIQIIVALSGVLVSLLAFLKTKAGKGLTNAIENDAAAKASLFASNTMFELALAALETTVKKARIALSDGSMSQLEFDELVADVKRDVMAKGKVLTIDRLLGSGAAPSEAAAVSFLSDKIEAALPGVKATSKNPPQPSAVG